MKRVLVIITLSLLFLEAVDAQWYYRKCGVEDLNNCTLEKFECLMWRTDLKVMVNIITTGVGTLSLAAGILYYADEGGGEYWIGAGAIMLIALGAFIDCISIPVLIVSLNRMSQLKASPVYDSYRNRSLSLSPTIQINQFNNSSYCGLSLTFNF